MDTLELPNRDHKFQLNIADPDAPPRSQIATKPTKAHPKWSPHIRFAPLPKINHQIETVIYPLRLRPPAYGIIAQRRVESRDKQGEDDVAADFRYWRREHPEEAVPIFEGLRSRDEVHPGRRLQVLIDDGEISPKSSYTPVIRAMRKLILDEKKFSDAEKDSALDRESMGSASTDLLEGKLICGCTVL